MAIKKYQFEEITPIIKEMFPEKSCKDMNCRFNMNSFGNLYNIASGFLTGNSYALKQAKKLVKGEIYSTDSIDDLDFSSPSKFLYYNTDKKEY
jgi:hypothetical protein